MKLIEPLTVWRLVAMRHAGRAFDGEGARLYGGRWNHPGIPVVYTSASLSLATLELFVHLDPEALPEDLVAIAAELPPGFEVDEIRAGALPPDWRSYPAPEVLKDLGTTWARSLRTPVLQIPSVVVPVESNYLLNSDHPEMNRIKVRQPEPFSFDRRMWKNG